MLRTLFRWLVSEGEIPASPMGEMKAPVYRQDEVKPFTTEEVERLLTAARAAHCPPPLPSLEEMPKTTQERPETASWRR